jgi:hypothetical protein
MDNKSTDVQFCQGCCQEIDCELCHNTQRCSTNCKIRDSGKVFALYESAGDAVKELDKSSDMYSTNISTVLKSFRSELTELVKQKSLCFVMAHNLDEIFFNCEKSNHWWSSYDCPNADSIVDGKDGKYYVVSHGLATMRLVSAEENLIRDVKEQELKQRKERECEQRKEQELKQRKEQELKQRKEQELKQRKERECEQRKEQECEQRKERECEQRKERECEQLIEEEDEEEEDEEEEDEEEENEEE